MFFVSLMSSDTTSDGDNKQISGKSGHLSLICVDLPGLLRPATIDLNSYRDPKTLEHLQHIE